LTKKIPSAFYVSQHRFDITGPLYKVSAYQSLLQHSEEAMGNYNYDSFGQRDVGAPDFCAVAKVGSQAPDFCLTDLDGGQVSLSSFRNKKHVLLEFGSIT
jgi:hypothetical protein